MIEICGSSHIQDFFEISFEHWSEGRFKSIFGPNSKKNDDTEFPHFKPNSKTRFFKNQKLDFGTATYFLNKIRKIKMGLQTRLRLKSKPSLSERIIPRIFLME
ncbi:hypothetical protein LEP1GSC120_1694 [Leptospira santarosai str. 200702252]|nr:hypothetical protein LEP1GSC130_0783 [Leptospira santarosai str. 200403458]EMO98947.1 hypothetical protein LEP1GSC120_1694 [Leptospira santarosai str. 200702252]